MKRPAAAQRRPRTMVAMRALLVWLALLCADSRAEAQLNPRLPAPAPAPAAPNATLVAEHARYEATFRGVRAYMAELARTDPPRHALLEPTFLDLRQRRRRVAGAGASLVVLGLVAVAMALTFDDDLSRTTRIGTMYGGAAATFVGGAMLGVLGGRHDAERFVEAHQRLIPRARLRIELSGSVRAAQLVARAQF